MTDVATGTLVTVGKLERPHQSPWFHSHVEKEQIYRTQNRSTLAEDRRWAWDAFTKRLEGSFRAKGNVLGGVW